MGAGLHDIKIDGNIVENKTQFLGENDISLSELKTSCATDESVEPLNPVWCLHACRGQDYTRVLIKYDYTYDNFNIDITSLQSTSSLRICSRDRFFNTFFITKTVSNAYYPLVTWAFYSSVLSLITST